MSNRMTRGVRRASVLALGFLICAFPRTGRAVEVSFERDTSLPVVYVNLVLKTGSVADPKEALGLTNFMGEMLLRGTKKRSKQEINEKIDQMGARLEIETRAEAMIIRGAVLSSQLSAFLDLLTEIATEPSFPPAEVESLKSEVISQILEELGSDQTLASRKFNEFLFRGHPYGQPVSGTIPDVQKFTGAVVSTQYDKLFHDKNLIVIGTGDAEESKIEAFAKRLGELRKGGEEFPEAKKPEGPKKRELEIVDKPDRTQTQIFIGQIGVRPTDKDFFPLYLGNEAFGGGSFEARLMDQIRRKRGWSYGAYSNFRFARQPRYWDAYLFPASKDTPAALAEVLRMIEELKKNGITKPEFDFWQQSLVNGAGFMYNTPKKRVENLVLEKTLDLPDGFMKSYGSKLKKISLVEVNQALKSYLQPNEMAITVLATAKDMKAKLAQAAGVNEAEVKVIPYTQE